MRNMKSTFEKHNCLLGTSGLVGLLALMACVWPARGQDSVPLYPGSPQPNPGEKLEVERVEIRRLGAIPREIHRQPGRFILLIVNQNSTDSDAAFVVDAATPAGTVNTPPVSHLLQLGGPAGNDVKHRSASLFDAPAGEFELKYAVSGQVICQIKIDTSLP